MKLAITPLPNAGARYARQHNRVSRGENAEIDPIRFLGGAALRIRNPCRRRGPNAGFPNSPTALIGDE
jgi:hypothetical protein